MNTKIIHDGLGRVIGQIQEGRSVVHISDARGKQLGRYIKGQNLTVDALGQKVGSSDQLLRLVRG